MLARCRELFCRNESDRCCGSFIEDKFSAGSNVFSYKHHYLLHALESDVLLDLLAAMECRQCVRIESSSSRRQESFLPRAAAEDLRKHAKRQALCDVLVL